MIKKDGKFGEEYRVHRGCFDAVRDEFIVFIPSKHQKLLRLKEILTKEVNWVRVLISVNIIATVLLFFAVVELHRAVIFLGESLEFMADISAFLFKGVWHQLDKITKFI